MLKRAIPLLLSLTLLTGCWGTKDIDHIVYVHAMGVDYKDHKFIVYVQFINFTGLAKTNAGGGQQRVDTAVGKATGETFNIVTDNIYPSIQQMVSWGQIKGIVFTERALKAKPVKDVLDLIDRYNEIRHTLWVYATKEPLDKLFSTVPLLQTSVYFSLLGNPEDIFQQSSFIRPIRLNRFESDLNEPGKTARVPYLGISEKTWEENHQKKPMLTLSGICFMRQHEVQKCFNRSKIMGIRWVEEKISRTPIYIKKGKKVVASVVVLGPKAKIAYKMNKGTPEFTVELKVQGSIIEVLQPLTEKELIDLAQKTIEKEIKDLYELGRKYDIDMLNLSEILYRENPAAWKRITVDKALPLKKDTLKDVKVKLSISTSGERKFTK
ncbi:Ger(x)C family spore germination protein [Anoxybacillus sp. PDR2]|uniref:Ger(x)C family spore germination protein n=1 Tax=Anoxybacillaceae TaxID=3120669 RepID=UPI00131776BB|nr:Ger(x)C family spore germination protein [Anoxybacillus sp. PDR2]QHC04201.1 Ger(x)C family spore germination protein [Anoxybacillus sp. PDR2]